MAFSLPPSKKVTRHSATPWALLLLALATWLAPVQAAELVRIGAAGVRVESASLEADAEVELQLNPTLEQALQRGIPLHFELRLEVTRPRWYWLDEEVLVARREYRLAYHALTRQYRLSSGSLHINHGSLADALRSIARVRNWNVGEAALLTPGQRYRASLSLRLDRARLPQPFQIDAFGSGEWSIEGGQTWEFIP